MTWRRWLARVAFTSIVSALVYGLSLIYVTPANGTLWIEGGERVTVLNMLICCIATVACFLAGAAAVIAAGVGMVHLFKAGWG